MEVFFQFASPFCFQMRHQRFVQRVMLSLTLLQLLSVMQWTPLGCAVESGHHSIVKMLLEHKASVEQTFVSRSRFITSSQTCFLFTACALPFDALLTMLTAFFVAECKR